MKYRGIIHFHSRYSHDSLTSPQQILRVAEQESLNFLLLTDHDTIEGSAKLKVLAESQHLNIEIPLAAEYKLDCGDVIAAFIKTEIKSRTLLNFEKEVRSQGGMILFPHPYQNHSNIEGIAIVSDLIEVFNSRQNKLKDKQALELATKMKKNVYYSPDAHMAKHLRNVIVEFERSGDLKTSLSQSKLYPLVQSKSSIMDLRISQAVKDFRKRNWIRFFAFPILVSLDILRNKN